MTFEVVFQPFAPRKFSRHIVLLCDNTQIYHYELVGQGWYLNLSVTAVDGVGIQQRPPLLSTLPEPEHGASDDEEDEEPDHRSVKSGKHSVKSMKSNTSKKMAPGSPPASQHLKSPMASPVKDPDAPLLSLQDANAAPDLASILSLVQSTSHPMLRGLHVQSLYADPAVAPRANLRLEPNPDVLSLSAVPIGGRSRKTIRLSNASPVPVPFHWVVWHAEALPAPATHGAGGKIEQMLWAMQQYSAEQAAGDNLPAAGGAALAEVVLPQYAADAPVGAGAGLLSSPSTKSLSSGATPCVFSGTFQMMAVCSDCCRS